MQTSRTFSDKPAVREAVPLLIGLVGSSGSGKTFSALRLATGIGGPIFFLDSEAKRALWYADKFKFQHVEFKEPFSPLDYLQAIEYCVEKGAKTIIIDSFSMEWEGAGGVLEMQENELERIAGSDYAKRDRCKMMAWIKPKMQHRKLLNSILQMPVNFIFCFRAKEKMDLSNSKQPKTMGWMPIASDDVIYEMSLNVLLMPNSRGVPCWHPTEMGEKAIIKLPQQFESIFTDNRTLDEDTGRRLAEWAKGVVSSPVASPKPVEPSSTQLETVTRGKPVGLAVTKQGDLVTGYKITLESGEILSTPEESVIDYVKEHKGFEFDFKHIGGQIEVCTVVED